MFPARLTALVVVLFAAFAVGPAGAAADTSITLPIPIPCVNAIVVQVDCSTGDPAPTTTDDGTGCKDAALLPNTTNLAAIRAATLCLLNNERTKRGLPRLHINASLGQAAKSFSRKLVQGHFFDHTSPDGTTMLQRLLRTPYLQIKPHKWNVGENIAYGTGTAALPEQIVKAWMNSPGHRANILNKVYRDIGLGVYNGTPKTSYGATYVTDFGRRIR